VELGVNRARNLGLQAASGKIVLFVDEDCYLEDPLFLAKHWQLHAENPHLSGLGGTYALPPQATLLDKAYHLRQAKWLSDSPRPGYKSDLLLGEIFL